MVLQYAIKISEDYEPEELDFLLGIISDERKKRINSFIFRDDKLRSLFTEVLLRYSLQAHYGLKNKDIVFSYNEYGKPFLENANHIYFNASHSSDWVICGIGNVPIGIDIEVINKRNMDLAKRFYTEEEYDFILKQPSEAQACSFCELWVLKESYVKAIGKGMNIPLDSFRFDQTDNMIKFYINNQLSNSYVFMKGQLDEKHCTAICIPNFSNNSIIKEIVVLDRDLLIKSFRK